MKRQKKFNFKQKTTRLKMELRQ